MKKPERKKPKFKETPLTPPTPAGKPREEE